MTTAAVQRKMVYMRGGRADPHLGAAASHRRHARSVRLSPLCLPDFVSLTLINALKRLPDLYIQDFHVRSITPITPVEEKWLWDTWGPSHRDLNPVLGRLDAVLDFTSPMWKESLHFIEPNLSGIGGLYFAPTCEQMLAEFVLPLLVRHEPALRVEVGQDLRELFLQELFDHLEAIGRAGRNICLIEPKSCWELLTDAQFTREVFQRRRAASVSAACAVDTPPV